MIGSAIAREFFSGEHHGAVQAGDVAQSDHDTELADDDQPLDDDQALGDGDSFDTGGFEEV